MSDNLSSTIIKNETDNVVYSYTQEEKQAIVEHINSLLLDDSDLKSMLPIDPDNEDIFESIRSGILTIKLINSIAPNTIPKEKIKIRKNYSIFETNENQEFALDGASKLDGVRLTNMGPRDFSEGKNPKIVLGLLWQLVRYDLLRKVGTIAKRDKDLSEDMLPEEILLRWVNLNLEAAGHDKSISNFSSDIMDCMAYIVLLNHLSPKNISLSLRDITDPKMRASKFLEAAAKIQCRKFINASDIYKGNNPRLNVAFVAHLFMKFNRIEEPVVEPPKAVPVVETVADEDIHSIEDEIKRLMEESKKLEEEDTQKEAEMRVYTEKLEKETGELQKALEQERERVSALSRKQDNELRTLKDRLQMLSEENNSTDGVVEIKKRIEMEEAEKRKITADQKKLEEKLDSVKEELEEQVMLRKEAEIKKNAIEEELKKAQLRHKTQLERLKLRVINAKMEEEKLAETLDKKIVEKDVLKEEVHQARREERNLTRTLNEEISQRERIEAAKHKLQTALREATSEVKEKTKEVDVEKRAKHRLQLRKDRTEKKADELRVQKTEALNQVLILQEEDNSLQGELEDHLISKKKNTTVNKQLQEELDVLEDEAEDASESARAELRRVAAEQKSDLEKKRREGITEKRKMNQVKSRIEDENELINYDIQDETHRLDVAKTQREQAQLEARLLSEQLKENKKIVSTLSQDIKEIEIEEEKTRRMLAEEKKAHRDAERQRQAHQKEIRKNNKLLDEEREEQEALVYETEELKSRVDSKKGNIEEEERMRKEKQKEASRLEKKLDNVNEELEDERRRLDKSVQESEERHKKALDKGQKEMSRVLQKTEKEKKRLEESAAQLAEALDDETRANAKLSAAKSKKEREVNKLNLQLNNETAEREEAERAKQDLEEQFNNLRIKLVTDEAKTSARSSSVKREKEKLAKEKEKGARNRKEAEETRAASDEASRQLEMEIEMAKTALDTQNREKKATATSKSALEDSLSAMMAEFEAGMEKKKDKSRTKSKDKKDELKKKHKKEKDGMEKELRNIASKTRELEEQLAEVS
ncbi:hypothetical protein PROFUN_13290 [Planoprotostelium fungivorum]|uniref:Calponin-homology (CH) domain-containing protein n=1 Tax=Planoprotostelium fungivorum TaxID=1890364 RepID=A0A2P6N4P5_9EUKA|nr:hypothetical protein PROFUN_13290 [Planoprotostelium fungivorum]